MYRFPECQTSLGMENGAIPDGHVSASSQWNANHAARQGRLNFQAVPGKAGSWSARRNDANQWLQIDLGNQFTRITLVATQGRNGYSQWVTKYKLQYSNDGVNFQYYREQGQIQSKVKTLHSPNTSLLCMMFCTTFTFVLNVYSRLNKMWIKDQIPYKFV